MYRNLDGNIDIGDARLHSAYPFTDDCSMTIGSITIPEGCVQAVRIMCTDGSDLPAELSSVSALPGTGTSRMYRVSFTDAAGTALAHADLSDVCTSAWTTSALLSDDGVMRGHITYSQEFASLAAGAANAAGGTARAAMRLRPECHVPWFTGIAQYIEAEGTRVNGILDIKPGILVHTEQGAGNAACISVVGIYREPSGAEASNGLCWLCVSTADADGTCHASNPVWIGGRNVVLRHSVESNLRVTCDGTRIVMKGVKDA